MGEEERRGRLTGRVQRIFEKVEVNSEAEENDGERERRGGKTKKKVYRRKVKKKTVSKCRGEGKGRKEGKERE